ncbi:MAG: Uncharacterized protein G01um101448_395 [Parcubacteria group bacterium Gr01-1014_48]|nr:MAG: Uncharacterized protein Greene041614_750 [Parcubacteria group bacterium Greene0416_14]TSC74015.1 MAG: Uncharacterized protein G01um101448_395 [Parcubacteria group bacterium Gr01-1014_48]TSD00793.1 MAG: Uncharacterized protein Greene101415_693 [Parcubacteria group bacterium Greene1014_15]
MKPILFLDFDGTLCHDRFWRSLEQHLLGKVQQYFTSNKEIIRDWMVGRYTSEEINRWMAEELSIEYDGLWNVFVSDCKSMSVSKNTLQAIKDFRSQYFTILITDNMDCFDRFTMPAINLQNYFDVVVNSYNRRISKNENNGELFKRVATENGLELIDSILIDNSETICKIFQNLGGQSLFVTKERPVDYWLDKVKSKTGI